MGWVFNATPKVNAESQYPTIIAICILLSVISAAVVVARLCVRRKARGLAADDYMAALSVLFAMIYSTLCIAQTRYGLGLPIASRPKENLLTYTRVNFAGRPIYQLGISFFKIALLISYLRLLRGTQQKVYRICVCVTIAVIFLAHLGCTLSLILACTPVSKSWNPLLKGSCLPAGPSFTGYAVVTIVSDIVVAIIPLPVLIRLEIPTSKKVGLIGIFTLGLFTTLCSIFRYLQIDRIQYGDGNSTMLILWGTIEFNVGNMVSSLPFLAPIFIRKAKQYRSKQSEDNATPNATPDAAPGARKQRGFGKFAEPFQMRDLTDSTTNDEETLVSHTYRSRCGSEDNILPDERGIIKSTTYSVEFRPNSSGRPVSQDGQCRCE